MKQQFSLRPKHLRHFKRFPLSYQQRFWPPEAYRSFRRGGGGTARKAGGAAMIPRVRVRPRPRHGASTTCGCDRPPAPSSPTASASSRPALPSQSSLAPEPFRGPKEDLTARGVHHPNPPPPPPLPRALLKAKGIPPPRVGEGNKAVVSCPIPCFAPPPLGPSQGRAPGGSAPVQHPASCPPPTSFLSSPHQRP